MTSRGAATSKALYRTRRSTGKPSICSHSYPVRVLPRLQKSGLLVIKFPTAIDIDHKYGHSETGRYSSQRCTYKSEKIMLEWDPCAMHIQNNVIILKKQLPRYQVLQVCKQKEKSYSFKLRRSSLRLFISPVISSFLDPNSPQAQSSQAPTIYVPTLRHKKRSSTHIKNVKL